MRLLFIRHGEPDYQKDSLTERGWKEAKLLAKRIAPMDIKEYYCSPLGRAKDTANPTLALAGREAEEMPWLREFWPKILRPDKKGDRAISWDWWPNDWTPDDRYYSYDTWHETEIMKEGRVYEEYRKAADGIDRILAEHGYVHEGKIFRAVKPNHDTLCFFCHYGITSVLVSHITHVSPMIFWHNFVMTPTSVTSLNTEEREEGTAIWRIDQWGDTSHLYKHNMRPSFAARFRETYDDPDDFHLYNDWEVEHELPEL